MVPCENLVPSAGAVNDFVEQVGSKRDFQNRPLKGEHGTLRIFAGRPFLLAHFLLDEQKKMDIVLIDLSRHINHLENTDERAS